VEKVKKFLMRFCSDSEYHKKIHEPFYSNNHLCSSDGSIIVVSKVSVSPRKSDLDFMLSGLMRDSSENDIVVSPKKIIKIKTLTCNECGGSGEVTLEFDGRYDKYSHEEDCKHCDGRGEVYYSFQEVESIFYLNEKIATIQLNFPDAVFYKVKDNLQYALRFESTNYFGYIIGRLTVENRDYINNAEYEESKNETN